MYRECTASVPARVVFPARHLPGYVAFQRCKSMHGHVLCVCCKFQPHRSRSCSAGSKILKNTLKVLAQCRYYHTSANAGLVRVSMQQARPCTRCTSFAAAQEWCRWCSRGAERVANVPECTKSVPSGTLRGCVRTRQQMVGCRSKAAHAFLVMSCTLALRGCTNGRGAAAGEQKWCRGTEKCTKVYRKCTPYLCVGTLSVSLPGRYHVAGTG